MIEVAPGAELSTVSNIFAGFPVGTPFEDAEGFQRVRVGLPSGPIFVRFRPGVLVDTSTGPLWRLIYSLITPTQPRRRGGDRGAVVRKRGDQEAWIFGSSAPTA